MGMSWRMSLRGKGRRVRNRFVIWWFLDGRCESRVLSTSAEG